jgi:hypothetical protein
VKVLVIESRTGRTAVSTDKGVTWTITASVYPAQLGWGVTLVCAWLAIGSLLRAVAALTDPGRPRKHRRGRRHAHSQPATGASSDQS